MGLRVRLSETYDLSTSKGKMGIIAIRTPSMDYIERFYPGFVNQFKFVRVVKGDVTISCASMLPADPLQIGTEAGKVAPQDMFNPLLYKAVSNDSWNGLVNRIYAGLTTSLSGDIVHALDAFPSASETASTRGYYGLLSDPSFRKAHPQAGLTMRGLRPLVWTLLHTLGTMPGATVASTAPNSNVYALSGTGTAGADVVAGSYLKGHAQPMPRVPTVFAATDVQDTSTGNISISKVLGYIPSTYCAVIIAPPSSLNRLYYRMVVTWEVEFTDVRSQLELGMLGTAAQLGNFVHYESFQSDSSKDTIPAKELAEVSETATSVGAGHFVEADGVDDLNLVMES